MATIITLQSSDLISNSRVDLNTSLQNLNTDKIETSVIDTDSTLAANSDAKIPSQKAIKAYIDTGGSAAFITALVPTGLILPYGGSAAPTNWFLCDGAAKSRSTYATLFAIVGTAFGIGDGSTTFNLPNLKGRVPVGAGAGTKVATFASRASNVITVTGLTNVANNEFQTGEAVLYLAPSGAMTGLTHNTTYYVIRISNTTFSLATTLALAQAGTAIALSSDGTGTQTFTLSLTARTVGDTGGEENHAMSATELLSHTHTISGVLHAGTSNQGGGEQGSSANAPLATAANSSTGGNAAMNVMNPFVSVNYIIKYT